MNMIRLVISSLLIGFVHCDLIGYNRLGNNVHSHHRFRNSLNRGNYRQQITNWFLENDIQVPSGNEMSIVSLQPTSGRQTRNNKRRNLYNRRMIRNT